MSTLHIHVYATESCLRYTMYIYTIQCLSTLHNVYLHFTMYVNTEHYTSIQSIYTVQCLQLTVRLQYQYLEAESPTPCKHCTVDSQTFWTVFSTALFFLFFFSHLLHLLILLHSFRIFLKQLICVFKSCQAQHSMPDIGCFLDFSKLRPSSPNPTQDPVIKELKSVYCSPTPNKGVVII